ncbi:MAG TPA: CstA-like transporter-associated (seleno)protein [Gemmatimonadales bacterium]|nr:CstA-like transporter-associated (seleno)protein [Gemmatimonadales bacterium]
MTRRHDATLHGSRRGPYRGTWHRGVVPRLLRLIRCIVGAPDYEAYLEHCQQAGHPPRLSEEEYVKQFFEAKGKGLRCC